MNVKVGSFFAGAGGLDYGFKQSGFCLEWANEIVPSFSKTYADFIGHPSIVGDFWQEQKNLPEVDIIIGGPPCQSFSLVGKRLSEDPRGKLVSGFKDLISERLPRAFLIENVPGLSASTFNGIRLPDYLKLEFEKLGYTVLVAKVNAAEYLVPQKRKRLVILGVKEPRDELSLLSSDEFRYAIEKRTGIHFSNIEVSAEDALGDLPSPVSRDQLDIPYGVSAKTNYAKLMRMGAGANVTHQNIPTMSKLDAEFVKHISPGGNYLEIPDSISTQRILNFKASGGRTTTYGRLHPNKPSYTVNTYFNRPNVGSNYHYLENRLITVREAMRLQSFPDTFEPTFKNQRELHIQIGNAVPPLLAESLALALKRAI